MTGWRPMQTQEAHQAAMSGRPVLLYGTPRYGPPAARHAIGYFVTGHGWLEVGGLGAIASFTPDKWQPLPEPPTDGGGEG